MAHDNDLSDFKRTCESWLRNLDKADPGILAEVRQIQCQEAIAELVEIAAGVSEPE